MIFSKNFHVYESQHSTNCISNTSKMIESTNKNSNNEKIQELVTWLHKQAEDEQDVEYGRTLECIADLLQRQHCPISVSVKPWENDGWCNELGQCWFGWKLEKDVSNDPTWQLCRPTERGYAIVCLPADALAVPTLEIEW